MPLHTFLEDGEHHHYEDKTFGEIGWRIHYFKYSKFTVRCPYPQSPVP